MNSDSNDESSDLTYHDDSDADEQEVDSEPWDERPTYVKTLTNDRSWLCQRSLNDGEPIPADKLPSDPNFVAGAENAEALYATVLKLQSKYHEHELVGLELVEEP